jgi:hypothetical protein
LLFIQKVPIFAGQDSDVVVGYLPIKVRYRINNTPAEICNLNRFYQNISKKYGVKVKDIIIIGSQQDILIQDQVITFDRILTGFYIDNKNWNRNFKIENIIENEYK